MNNEKTCGVYFKAQMPEHLLRKFLQYLRDFEQQYDKDVLAEMVVNVPHLPEDEARQLFASINPPIPYAGRSDWSQHHDAVMDKIFRRDEN